MTPAELLALMHRCQDGRATCLYTLQKIERHYEALYAQHTPLRPALAESRAALEKRRSSVATKWREGWAVELSDGTLWHDEPDLIACVSERREEAERGTWRPGSKAVRVRYCEPVVIETKKARGKK